MLRRELLERLKKLEEKIHWLAGLLAVLFVLTYEVEQRAERLATEEAGDAAKETLHHGLETLDHVLIGGDILVALTFVAILVFRRFGLRKATIPWSRIVRDDAVAGQFDVRSSGRVEAELPCEVRFCDRDSAAELNRLNYNAFAQGPFGIEEERLERRNGSWIERNPRIFMMILDPLDEQRSVMGYSSIVPLTAEGLDAYLSIPLRDADIPASLIATDKFSTAAVLLFAIHLLDAFSFTKSNASRRYTEYFLACVKYHTRHLFDDLDIAREGYPPIYVQTDDGALERRLIANGFVNTHRSSGDGYDIYVLAEPFQDSVPGGNFAG